MFQALVIILSHVILILLLSWGCFRRYRFNRPAIGVMNMGDVAFMLGIIVLIPILYLLLPTVVMIVLLTIAAVSGLYILFEAVCSKCLTIWLIVLLFVAADLWTFNDYGVASAPFFAVNNVIQVLIIISITNLWAQSGMKASAVVNLGLALIAYDFVFTSLLSFMGDLFDQLQYVPFSPMIAWRTGISEQWLAIGFGDLALAAVFPLVMRKAFSKQAGLVALGCAFGAFLVMGALAFIGLLSDTFPLMVVLGPLMAGQYLFWRRWHGQERSMQAYLRAEVVPFGTVDN